MGGPVRSPRSVRGGAASIRFSVAKMDRAEPPSRSFYRYASGGWIDAHPTPADQARWSGFDELRERNFLLLRKILEEAARRPGPGPDGKVGTFYRSALDVRARDRAGIAPVADDLRRVGDLGAVADVPGLLGRLHRLGGSGLFETAAVPDERDSRHYALYLWQGGLALPDREYYLSRRFAAVRRAYQRHIERLLRRAGDAAPAARRTAREVLRFETEIARASRNRVALREPTKNYHRMSPAQLARRYPRLRWADYLRELGVGRLRRVVVGQPEFFDALNRLAAARPLGVWRSYLRWQILHDAAPFLDTATEREDFDFFHRRLLGQPRPEPPWRRAAVVIDHLLGEALGRLYVRRHFPPRTRAKMLELVDDLRDVLADRLRRVPWMTPTTRARAGAKFARFTTKVGHPATFRRYAGLRLTPTDYAGNVRRARAFEAARQLARVGRLVDRDEWHMTAPTVNAHFVPTQNQIFFPAGILQPPFFDPTIDDAVNYGGIAVVIGHEMTHGYDDQGRKFDADGNLVDWWGPSDAREFGRRAGKLIEQYSRFEPLPGEHLNGALTAGENIADLGGVSLAYEALQRRLADGRTRRDRIDGFTPEQRFFLSYGQIWRGNARPEELRRRLAVDPHSPGEFRVNGVLANLPEFWKAFAIPEGSAMRQDERRRAEIW